MREMLIYVVIEILNAEEILVNCKFKSHKNLNVNLYREIQTKINKMRYHEDFAAAMHVHDSKRNIVGGYLDGGCQE